LLSNIDLVYPIERVNSSPIDQSLSFLHSHFCSMKIIWILRLMVIKKA